MNPWGGATVLPPAVWYARDTARQHRQWWDGTQWGDAIDSKGRAYRYPAVRGSRIAMIVLGALACLAGLWGIVYADGLGVFAVPVVVVWLLLIVLGGVIIAIANMQLRLFSPSQPPDPSHRVD